MDDKYYEVHCTNCGKVLSADKMAFNVDKILTDYLGSHLSRAEEADIVRKTAKKIFSELKIGMYLTKQQMEDCGILAADGTLRLSCLDVLGFISRQYDVDINQIKKKEEETYADVDENEMEEDEDEDIGDMDDPYEDLWDTEDADLAGAGSEVEIPPQLLTELCGRMQLYEQTDRELETKKEYITELLQMLKLHERENLLVCRCMFDTAKDDQNLEFFSTLKVTFSDHVTQAYNHLVCPDCGEEFFIDAGKFPEYIIVMLGSSRVGKTAYLAALMDTIQPEYGRRLYPLVIKDTVDLKHTNFTKTILEVYRDGKKIPKTDERKEAAALFSLEIKIANEKTAIFTFVDLPGEVFVPNDSEEKRTGEIAGKFIINHRKICNSAHAFWFCIDPVQIDRRLEKRNKQEDSAEKVEQNINRVFANIDIALNLMGKKAEVPTAVIITKSDLVTGGVELYSGRKDRPDELLWNNKFFMVNRLKEHADKVKQYLSSDNVKDIMPNLRAKYPRINFFAVAAYGADVKNDSPVQKAPSAIMLPFLWTLSVFGYLPPVDYEVRVAEIGTIFRRGNNLAEGNYKKVDSNMLYDQE